MEKLVELVPSKWQTLVITPVLLLALGALGGYVYADKKEASAQTAEKVDRLERSVLVLETEKADTSRRITELERAVWELNKAINEAVGNARGVREAEEKLRTLPPSPAPR